MLTHPLPRYEVVDACSHERPERCDVLSCGERPEEAKHRLELRLEVEVVHVMGQRVDWVERRDRVREVCTWGNRNTVRQSMKGEGKAATKSVRGWDEHQDDIADHLAIVLRNGFEHLHADHDAK